MPRPLALLLLPLLLVATFVLAPGRAAREEGPSGEEAPLTGTLAVDLVDGIDQAGVDALAHELGLTFEWTSPVSHDDALLRTTPSDPTAALAALRADPRVEAAEPLIEMQALGAPNDPLWPKQWNLHGLGVEAGWRAGGGRGVTVAVLDTGITRVEDLVGTRFAEGLSFVPGVDSTEDDVGHGTHVAGTIAQATDNGIGVAGVAPGVTLLPMKVLGASGGGSADRIAAAVDEAADRGAQVINLSLGGPHSAVLHLAVEKAVRRGVSVVASAGNTGRLGVGCPAHADGVLGVSALGPDGDLAPYSTFGPGVEIAAPGGDLRKPDGGILQDTIAPGGHAYTAYQGTSMAAPHVAGAVAVLRGTGLSARGAEDALLRAAEGGGPGDLRLGAGRLDLGAALRGVSRAERPTILSIVYALVMLLGLLGKLKPRERMTILALALLLSGGLWIVRGLGLPRWATADALGLPAALSAPGAGASFLWASAAVPLLLAGLLGLSKRLWTLPAAVAVAWAVGLTWGAGSGWIDLPWLGIASERLWLGLNGLLALAVAMGVVGARAVRT
jgi:serine protease